MTLYVLACTSTRTCPYMLQIQTKFKWLKEKWKKLKKKDIEKKNYIIKAKLTYSYR